MAKEEWGYKDDVDADMIVPVYATYEARIKQMKGEIEFLKIMLSDDEEMLVQGMAAVMGLISYLALPVFVSMMLNIMRIG